MGCCPAPAELLASPALWRVKSLCLDMAAWAARGERLAPSHSLCVWRSLEPGASCSACHSVCLECLSLWLELWPSPSEGT